MRPLSPGCVLFNLDAHSCADRESAKVEDANPEEDQDRDEDVEQAPADRKSRQGAVVVLGIAPGDETQENAEDAADDGEDDEPRQRSAERPPSHLAGAAEKFGTEGIQGRGIHFWDPF